MIRFSAKYFKKIQMSNDEVVQFYGNAMRDLSIAKNDQYPEVRFTYSYQALVKAGITLIAHVGQVKVKSVPGHHVKLLEKLSEILVDADILSLGNAIRMKRNTDLYGGGELISEKEADDYCRFVEDVVKRVGQRIKQAD